MRNLVSKEQLDYLRSNLNNVLYLDSETCRAVRGTSSHGDWESVLLRHEDGEQLGWDLDACNIAALYRMDKIFDNTPVEGK